MGKDGAQFNINYIPKKLLHYDNSCSTCPIHRYLSSVLGEL